MQYYTFYYLHTIHRTGTFDPDPKKMIFHGLIVCPSMVILHLIWN